jgi:cell division protein FtsW
LVLFLAARFSSPDVNFTGWVKGFFLHLWPALLVVALCMLQPDFGSTALIVSITAIMLFLGGVRPKYLLTSAMVVVPLMAFAMWAAPYRRARLFAFMDPWADPQGTGFQIIQSFLAFYRGGLFGVGLGNSRAKIFYLPEAHNDFILSVVGEELGFIGIAILSLAFLFLIFRGIKIAAKSSEKFHGNLAAGLAALLGLEVFWNASIVLGLMPTKGMNLPFISSGGSSIICALAAIGLLLNISAHNHAANRD